jgi:hypothetical protein
MKRFMFQVPVFNHIHENIGIDVPAVSSDAVYNFRGKMIDIFESILHQDDPGHIQWCRHLYLPPSFLKHHHGSPLLL